MGSFDLAKDFGFSDLSGKGLADLRKYLEDSNNFDQALNYLVSKIGFNPQDQDQFDTGIAIYADKDLVTTKKHKIGEFICQMHKSMSADEYTDCIASANLIDETVPIEYLQ